MPAIEFLGYSRKEALTKMNEYAALFRDLPYASDFIFHIEPDSTVMDLNGVEQPLVRVRSRYTERAYETRDILAPFEDVEIQIVEFHQRERGSS